MTPEDEVTTNTQRYMEQAYRLLVIPVCFTYSGENKLSMVPTHTVEEKLFEWVYDNIYELNIIMV